MSLHLKTAVLSPLLQWEFWNFFSPKDFTRSRKAWAPEEYGQQPGGLKYCFSSKP